MSEPMINAADTTPVAISWKTPAVPTYTVDQVVVLFLKAHHDLLQALEKYPDLHTFLAGAANSLRHGIEVAAKETRWLGRYGAFKATIKFTTTCLAELVTEKRMNESSLVGDVALQLSVVAGHTIVEPEHFDACTVRLRAVLAEMPRIPAHSWSPPTNQAPKNSSDSKR